MQVAHISTALTTRDRQKMKRILLAGLIAITLPNFTQAKDITKFGLHTCSEWIKAKGADQAFLKGWVLGWITSLNNVFDKQDYLSKLESQQQAYLFVNNYCRTNPNADIEEAADQLMAGLIRKK